MLVLEHGLGLTTLGDKRKRREVSSGTKLTSKAELLNILALDSWKWGAVAERGKGSF